VLELLGADLRNSVRPGSITLLDPDEWYPVDWTNPVHRLLRKDILDNKQLLAPATARRLFDRASMVTYWSHSW
jgi:inositol phosphorylceramide mannosyltransferase catalytic subunit